MELDTGCALAEPATATYKIMIVDDHPIVRRGLIELIGQAEDLTVCAQAEDVPEAMRGIRKLQPDLVVVDLFLRTSNGLDLVKDVKTQFPHIYVLMLSMRDEFLYAERALRAGARGYLTKNDATDKIVAAIRKILSGRVYLSDSMATRMVNRIGVHDRAAQGATVESLSDRELEVFGLIGQGFGTRTIAERLHLSVKTIETYRAHIKQKLDLSDSSELLRYAIEWMSAINY